MTDDTSRDSPKDIFQQAVDRLYSYMQPHGFTLLKSNEIKRKCGKFTARVFFFRSYKNYISHEEGHGSVTTEVHCLIDVKGYEGAYRLSFGNGPAEKFQLLGEGLSLDTATVDGIWAVIESRFVDVVNGLEDDPLEQFVKMGLMPEASPSDFSHKCYLKRPLLEAFGFEGLLHTYDENCKLFYSPDVAERRGQDSYFEMIRDQIDPDYCESLSYSYLLELLEEAYRFLRTTERYNEHVEAEYRLCLERKDGDKARFVIAVFQFLYPGTYVRFPRNKAIRELNKKTLSIYEGLIR
ncbi:MAG: hypothetical protein FWH47_03535 [Methanomassiliicoccaceae archaeon]|nr:hypothetical protein [Methanomassiliicoccaceae archaeon]MCL2148394.1 hypothetical protein [Methanomassiliicoccaceae archaeon]